MKNSREKALRELYPMKDYTNYVRALEEEVLTK